MQLVLVSACLLGNPVRYDGRDARCQHPVLARWLAEGRIVSLCPEMAGGLPTPRPPAEIEAARGGRAVLEGRGRVIDHTGQDVTPAFARGAEQAVSIARSRGIRLAVLKENSPSCGSRYTYDGSFSGVRLPSMGVTAAALQEAGVRVFSEAEFETAQAYLALMAQENR